VPTALLAWLIFRVVALSDVSVDWRRPQSLIYGLLISQSAHRVVPDQGFIPPWRAISIAVGAFNATHAIDLLAGSFYLLVLILGAKRLWKLRVSYLFYSVVIIFVSFSYSTGTSWSYMGLPRHCLLAFPLVFLLADWGTKQYARLIINFAGSLWLIILTTFYALHLLWLP